VEVPFQKENALGPEAIMEENGEEVCPSSSDLRVFESIVSFPSR